MGWFNKKGVEEDKKRDFKSDIPELPQLPELPELPELPDINKKKEKTKEPIHQLPTFPNSSLGQKFSQNTIKEAVTRIPKQEYSYYPEEKKGERVFEADDFAPKKKVQMMPKPIKPLPRREFDFPKTKEIEPEEEPEFEFDVEEFKKEPKEEEFDVEEFRKEPKYEEFEEEPEEPRTPSPIKREPVFIRIDKFEESLKTFEKAKRELAEIEKVLKDIEKVKEDEQNELESWKNNTLKIKEQIEKVDRDIFSRLE